MGFLFLCVSDRAVAIARALQARTWAERFYDPPYAVVEDSGGYRETPGGKAETVSRQGTSYGDVPTSRALVAGSHRRSPVRHAAPGQLSARTDP